MSPVTGALTLREEEASATYIYIIFSNSTWPSTVWIVPTAYFVENFGAILVFSFAYFKFHFLFIPLALVDQNLCLLLIYVSWY
jgi:hypothetical protein